MKQNTKDYIIKLFWIFIIASIIGCAVETIVCIVQKGHFEIRQGVIYGPFIPVYGAGAVLFYIFVPLITGATAENAGANTDNNGETVYDAEYNVENEDDKKDENK